MSQERWIAGPPASRVKSVEWYTPARYVEAARSVMGGIDLDPASSELANTVVKATRYYDVRANGLEKAWSGRVWLNPPYGRGDKNVSYQEIWSCRLIAQYEAGITREAILLVNSAHDTRWFQRLWTYPVCLVSHRISFYSPTGTSLRAVSGASHGSAFAYFGPHVARFYEVFSTFGRVVPPVAPDTATSLWERAS